MSNSITTKDDQLSNNPAYLDIRTEGINKRVILGGIWKIDYPWPEKANTVLELAQNKENTLILCTENLEQWDSNLLTFLKRLVELSKNGGATIQNELPKALQRLLALAFAIPARGQKDAEKEVGFLEGLGGSVSDFVTGLTNFLIFFGDVCISLARLCCGKSQMRFRDFSTCLYECSINALPIVSITSMLFGLILAFVGAVQLKLFGAQIFVAGLVGIGTLRVMGAVMVGIVMSGRIGASYAAIIGTMQVNEEIDALQTTGLSSIDFLVLPRVLALTLMMPLLTIYADLMGVLGGFLVAITMLDISPMAYINATSNMVPLTHGLIGLCYATTFGVIIAISGCYSGILCGRSALAVGKATTEAVVHSLVGIIIATAIITIICNVLQI